MVKTKVLRLVLAVLSRVLGNEAVDASFQVKRRRDIILPLHFHRPQAYQEESYFHYLPQ
ncbi:MAG: hypothetical protein J0M12_14540 [Deltaproteobacteria bacterium]|nr:hypothetical protein [Deltaproteobacteria bacterium]